MSQANELLTKLQAETIDVIKAQQETMLAAAKQWSEAMSSMVPAAAAAMPNMPSMPNLAKDLIAVSKPAPVAAAAPKKSK